MHMNASLSCIFVHHVCSCWKSEKGVGFPKTGFRDDCELPCGHRKLNPSPLKNLQVLLITEPSLQHQPALILSTYTLGLILCTKKFHDYLNRMIFLFIYYPLNFQNMLIHHSKSSTKGTFLDGKS